MCKKVIRSILFLVLLGINLPANAQGTVTNVATDSTLTGGPITTSGTLGVALTHSNIWTGAQTFTPSQASNTSTDGINLVDSTAATAANQQYSPRIRLTGQGWKTTATAASQPVDWIVENQPIQGTTNPSSNLVFSSQINGGGYVPYITLRSNTGALILNNLSTKNTLIGFGISSTITGNANVVWVITREMF